MKLIIRGECVMSNSILKRENRSGGSNNDRYRYITSFEFYMHSIKFGAKAVVDTGSPSTVITKRDMLLTLKGLYKDKAELMQTKIVNKYRLPNDVTVKSASGQTIHLVPIIVDNFKLTADIVIDKLKIYVSEDISNSVLGMDLLSSFRGIWDWQRGNMLVEMIFVDWEDRLDILRKRCTTYNNKLATGYIDTDFIMLMEKDDSSTNELRIVMRALRDGCCVGYVAIDNKGNKVNLSIQDALKLAKDGVISNATTCRKGTKRFLKGKNCSLLSLPVLKV